MLFNEVILEKYQDQVLTSVLNAKKDCITIIWNEKDEIILVTKTFESYFNVSLQKVVDKSWHFIFPQHINQQIIDHFKQTSQLLNIPHLVLSDAQNIPIYFSITIEIIEAKDGKLFICTMNDITKKYELEQSLNRLEKALLTAQLSANIVHEIRNPLTSIKGFLQLIEAGVEHREQYFRVLVNEIEKIEGLTYELLQMANPNKDKKQTVFINQLINDVLLLMETQSTMKQITFDVSGDLHVPIYCNPNEIKQVFINIILNGAEAMDGRGTISINVTRTGRSVKIKIIDDGHGMSEDVKKKISDAFFTTKETGTGLGLVVTNHIINKHHGKLSIISYENKGSTFEIELPLLLTN